ncbi:hypothetical protein OKW41_000455 [Paraburkholderia sp. UCT70]
MAEDKQLNRPGFPLRITHKSLATVRLKGDGL